MELKIYEKGITPPIKSHKKTLKRVEDFIQYSEIDAIYTNPNERYIIVNLKKKPFIRPTYKVIVKEHISNMEEFKNVLEGRVKIIEDEVWKLGRRK